MSWKFKKVKKWVACIVIFAFLFQAVPIYAFQDVGNQLPVTSDLPADTENVVSAKSDSTEFPLEDAFPAQMSEDVALENQNLTEENTEANTTLPKNGGTDALTEEVPLVEEESEDSEYILTNDDAYPDEMYGERVIEGELEDLREPNIKYFMNEDNTITASVYPCDVHYEDENGDLQDIDNSLEATTDEESTKVLANTENAFSVKFAKKIKEKNLVKLEKDGHQISWGLVGADGKKIIRQKAPLMPVISENPQELEKATSTVVYSDIKEKVDLQYDLLGTEIKESIVLKDASAPATYQFRFNTKDLVIAEEDGKLNFKTQDGAVVYQMMPLVMNDAMLETSMDIDVSVTAEKENKNNHEYLVTITPSQAWLTDPEREYPVVIDPSISTEPSPNIIMDTYISSSAPNTVQGYTAGYLKVGMNGSTENRTLINPRIPSQIQPSDRVVSAELYLTPYLYDNGSLFTQLQSSKGAPVIEAHEITGSWNDTTVTWNNQPSFDSKILDYDYPSTKDGYNADSRFYTWDVTQLVDRWCAAGHSKGLMLKYPTGYSNTMAVASFCSANYGTSAARPVFNITYMNMVGLEDYWTYHSQDAGLAGQGYVNDYTGTLTTTFNDIDLDSEKLPLSINHVFSSYSCGEVQPSLNVGKGFRLSVQESIKTVTMMLNGKNVTKYLYTDGDGTQHYFEKGTNNIWRDDSGLDYTLEITSSSFTIRDKKDNLRVFSKTYDSTTKLLEQIKDNHGNTITMNFDGTNLRSITDSDNRTVTFNVDSNNRLTSMTLPNNKTIYYQYITSGPNEDQIGCLSQVTFPGQSEVNTGASGSANVAAFEYTVGGCIKKLTDVPKEMSIVYDVDWINSDDTGGQWNSGFRRVNSYSVVQGNGAVKNKYTIAYNAYNTRFVEETPSIGRYEVYSFNTMGQTVSALDQDGNAIFSAMGMSGGAKNKVTFASKTQRVNTNYLKNHDCERTTYFDVTSSKTSENHITFKNNDGSDVAFTGTGMLKMWKKNIDSVPAYAAQTVTVPGNAKYTFSAYVKTSVTPSSSTSGGAYLRVQGPAGVSAVEKSDIISSDYIRHQVTVDLSNRPGNTALTVYVGMKNASGVVCFDSLQLEKGECANRYNLLENGDFEQAFATAWTGVNLGGNPAGINDGIGSTRHTGTGGFQFYGLPKTAKQIKNTTSVMGKKGEGLVYGAWIKSNGVPDKDTSKNGTKQCVGVTLQLVSATGQAQYSAQNIMPTDDEWIYVTGNAIANFDYTSANIIVKSNYNANYTYFDDAFLFKDSFGESFNYDAKGNIVTAVDMAKNTESVVSNGNNDLTTYKDGLGNQYSFVYNYGDTASKKHDVTQCTAPDNTYTKMGYDSGGRLTDVAMFPSSGSGEVRTKNIYSGAYLSQSMDQREITTYYTYDQSSGLLQNVSNPGDAGTKTSYSYDGNTEKLTNIAFTGLNTLLEYGYSKENLSKIKVGEMLYNFNYDTFGKLISVGTGTSNHNVEEYEYAAGRDVQSKVTYGNNQSISYQYDNQDRMIGAQSGTTKISTFDYNDNALLGKATYYSEGTPVSTEYQYDFAERYVSCYNTKGFGIDTITYDKNNNNTGYNAYLRKNDLNVAYSTANAYNNVNNLTRLTAAGNSYTDYSYDAFGRNQLLHMDTAGNTAGSGVWQRRDFLNFTGSNGARTTNFLSGYIVRYSSNASSEAADYTYNYGYDKSGNVTSAGRTLKNGSSLTTNYTYDKRNQLTRASNSGASGIRDDYAYDKRGNLTEKKHYSGNTLQRTATYTYGTAPLDQLTSYVEKNTSGSTVRSKTYSYDGAGNPQSININGSNYSLTWEQGKQLKSISGGGKSNSFCYNESGLISKVTKANGETVQYYYDDGQLEYEEYRSSNGSLTRIHKYFYDEDGNVQYLLTKTGYFTNKDSYNLYAYVYDGLGNITDLVRFRAATAAGSNVSYTHAAHYEYDAYGQILQSTSSVDSIAAYNPIKYKGYYYNSDFGYYYLQSRFYDPETGRFLNADDVDLLGESQADITDKNLYNYCDNNPVMRKDGDGEFWHILVGAVIGAGVELISCAIEQRKPTIGGVAVAAGTGAATAALGPAMGAAVSGVSGYASARVGGASKSQSIKKGAIGAGLCFIGGQSGKTAVKAFKNLKWKSIKADLKALKPNKKNLSKWWKKNTSRKRKYTRHRITSLLSSYYSGKLQIIYSGTRGRRR